MGIIARGEWPIQHEEKPSALPDCTTINGALTGLLYLNLC